MTNTVEAAEQSVQKFFERYNAHRVDEMLALFVPEATVEYVPLQSTGPVESAGKDSWAGLIDAFPDLSNTVDSVRITADGRFAYADVTIRGTQSKDAFGIESQGKSYDVRHLFVIELDSQGRIASMTAFWDNADWYRQLGKTQIAAGP